MAKELKSRIQHKNDIQANWEKATNFIPLAGEMIIYNPDADHTYARFKIGNGVTAVNDLPFYEEMIDQNIAAAVPTIQMITWGADD